MARIRKNRRSGKGYVVAAVASLGVHLVVGAIVLSRRWDTASDGAALQVAQPGATSADADDTPLEIETLVDRTVEALQRPVERTEEEKKQEEEKKKDEANPKQDGQVVDIARPTLEQRPDKANYLAEYDSTVAHETRGPSGLGQAGAPEAVVATQQGPTKVTGPQGNPLARPGPVGPLALNTPTRARPSVVPPPGTPQPQTDAEGEQPTSRPGPAALPAPSQPLARQRSQTPGGGGIPGVPGLPNLSPSQDVLARAVGKGAGSPDALRDVDDGESTALNAKSWKFASFFNRVKRSVAEHWHPNTVYLQHDPSGNVYGIKDRVTLLKVHLHGDGSLADVEVAQSSGVEFLDDEAMEAFRRAQPFPNPPSGLVEADGQVHFRFGFIFELSGQRSLKIFRYNE